MSLLRLEKVVVDYGSIHALKEIDIDVNTGEVITLIGANGAGKSTTKKAIMGLIPVKSGKIWFDGKEITMHVKEGQKVIYSKYAGNEVKLDGEEYVIVRQSDILAIVE